jgi:polyferredoxin
MRSMKKLTPLQLAMLPLPILVLGGGILVSPLFGLLLLPLMAAIFILAAVYRSRRFCGSACARGVWLDLLMPAVSRHRAPPRWLGKSWFRQAFRGVFMALFAVGLYVEWGTWAGAGRVLVAVCAATTAIAFAAAWLYRPRTWCSFCPMATMQITIARLAKGKQS